MLAETDRMKCNSSPIIFYRNKKRKEAFKTAYTVYNIQSAICESTNWWRFSALKTYTFSWENLF